MKHFGYAGKILDVDLSQMCTVDLPTEEYADRFIGGRGFAAKLYWDKVSPQTRAFDPDNCIIFTTGPLAGFARIGGSRWQVCGKSPAMNPQRFSYANLGGNWGAWLKFAGYDAVAIQGCSDKPVYLFIHDGISEIRDATFLTGKDTAEVREILQAELGKNVRVATTSPAGENLVTFANVIADRDSSGSGGFGSVMGSKKLKAIAVAGKIRPVAAQPDRSKEVIDYFNQLKSREMKLKEILPSPVWMGKERMKRQPCFGCTGCMRGSYYTSEGKWVKYFCQTADMYTGSVIQYYGDWNEVAVQAAVLCGRFGLDSMVLQPMISWLGKCYQEGILQEKETGLPLSKIGSLEFIESLVSKISFREGFGDILANGTLKAAELLGKGAKELIGDSIINSANELTVYDPRVYITNQLLYATETRRPMQQLHDTLHITRQWDGLSNQDDPAILSGDDIGAIAERYWGNRIAGDMSTYEGKALAAKKIQDRTYAKESLIVCDYQSPIMTLSDTVNHVGDPTIESRIYSAVTGKEKDETGLNKTGERIFNLQRAIHLREGWGGRQGDVLPDTFHNTPVQEILFSPECLVPGKAGEPYSRKGAVVDKEQFEKLKSEYYELRGWDTTTGLLTMDKLKELELSDISSDLEQRGLLR